RFVVTRLLAVEQRSEVRSQRSEKIRMEKTRCRKNSALRFVGGISCRDFVGAKFRARIDPVFAAELANHQRGLQLFRICPANVLADGSDSVLRPPGKSAGNVAAFARRFCFSRADGNRVRSPPAESVSSRR